MLFFTWTNILPVYSETYIYMDEKGEVFTQDAPLPPNSHYELLYKGEKDIEERPVLKPKKRLYLDYEKKSATANSGIGNNESNIATRFDGMISEIAYKYGVEASLVKAIIHVGSHFQVDAISKSGAQGLMQLKPETANYYGVKDILNPRQNIEGGARYLRYLSDFYDGNLQYILSAYESGEPVPASPDSSQPMSVESGYIDAVMYYYSIYSSFTGENRR